MGPEAKKAKTGDADTLARMLVQGVSRVLQNRAKEGKGPLPVSELAEEFKVLWKVPFNLQSAGYDDVNTFLKAWPNKVEVTSSPSGDLVSVAKKPTEKAAPAAVKPAEQPAAKKAPPPVPQAKTDPPVLPPKAAVAADTTAPAEGEPPAKKAKATDADTLSRMLVQGVVRVLQTQGELLVSSLAEEFKTLWKVPFNLQSAGYTDVNTFLKAWPNKVELSSSPAGDVVSLAKKSTDKAPAPAAAKSAAPARIAPAATASVSPVAASAEAA